MISMNIPAFMHRAFAFNRLTHGTVNAALCLNSGKRPAYGHCEGERVPVHYGISVKKYLGEIERQINVRANARCQCVVFSRDSQPGENPTG